MDTNNSSPTPPSGELALDSGDWRATLRPESRRRIVDKITETLKRHLPFCGQEGLNELEKIAVKFEEKVFTAASSESDYLRRISLKMLTMETRCRNKVLPQSVPNNMASDVVQSSAGLQSGVPFVSGPSQNPISNVVAQNSDMQNVSGFSQDSMWQGMPLNIVANQMMQIQGMQQVLPQQQPQGHLQSSLVQSHMQQQQQQNVLQPSQLHSSQQSDSTAQTGHANGSDHQEKIYQKLEAMKETYLPELQDMHQKISAKLLQYDSLPHQLTSEQLDKLKLLTTLLERVIHMLTCSRASMVPANKEKLSLCEKQIINFINACKSRKPVSALQQGQLTPLHMHSMQKPQLQINQTQSHDYQMNPQLTMQPNNMTSLQHNLDPGPGNALGSMQQQVAPGTYEQAGSECPAPEPAGNGMSTMSIPHLSTDFIKPNVAEKPHDPAANKANPNSLRSTVVTIVDEASTAVGEDLAAMRKQGLRAFTQTGMSGAFKIRCYLSALVILALIICFIFKLNHQ